MKALLLVDGDKDKIAIKEIKKPVPGEGEVLIKIKASALNHRDQWCRMGMYPSIKYDTVLGSDGAGTVEAIGQNTDDSWLNKEVVINPNINWGDSEAAQAADYQILGMPSNGTFAEYIAVNQDRIHSKPSHLSMIEAGALPLGGMTAFRAVFTKGQVEANQQVLVTGIGGGVAQFAFQFAKTIGAKVSVTSGSKEKLDRAIADGASSGYNYKEADWVNAVLKETHGFDVIVDSAGGNQVNEYLKLVKPGGRIVHYGSTTGATEKLDLFRLFWSQASIQGTTMGSDKEFALMLDFVTKHQLVPIIDSTRPFDQIVSAFDDIHAGKQLGKLVIEH